jgi:hypothetical protein
MMVAVTRSGDPDACWQLEPGVDGALRSNRGADWGAPLKVIPGRLSELESGLLARLVTS